ncbi:nitrogen fixation protein NifQ [Niveibacterium terrae]|uniref:nitrogen fixation protein NifQ n=1 Tax=Niveibacterium terrae TaxID=3373598 RepID=UPI003A95DBA1
MKLATGPALLLSALAGCLALSWARQGYSAPPVPGLSAARMRRALERFFPGYPEHFELDWKALSRRDGELPDDETEDILELLIDSAATDDEEHLLLAHLVAAGCRGSAHLWEDMGLASRSELSALLAHYFPALAARNTGDMKWKKFFYKQLCEREAITICRAPSCRVCPDHPKCFGPEEARGGGLFAVPVVDLARGTLTP